MRTFDLGEGRQIHIRKEIFVWWPDRRETRYVATANTAIKGLGKIADEPTLNDCINTVIDQGLFEAFPELKPKT